MPRPQNVCVRIRNAPWHSGAMGGVYLRRIWTGGACGIQNNGWKSITKNSLLPGSLTSYLAGRESPRRCATEVGDLLIPNSPGERKEFCDVVHAQISYQ